MKSSHRVLWLTEHLIIFALCVSEQGVDFFSFYFSIPVRSLFDYG